MTTGRSCKPSTMDWSLFGRSLNAYRVMPHQALMESFGRSSQALRCSSVMLKLREMNLLYNSKFHNLSDVAALMLLLVLQTNNRSVQVRCWCVIKILGKSLINIITWQTIITRSMPWPPSLIPAWKSNILSRPGQILPQTRFSLCLQRTRVSGSLSTAKMCLRQSLR